VTEGGIDRAGIFHRQRVWTTPDWPRSSARRSSGFSSTGDCSALSGSRGSSAGGTRASTSIAGSGPGQRRRPSGSGSTWYGRCWPWSACLFSKTRARSAIGTVRKAPSSSGWTTWSSSPG
jgi:hypothetical protein